MPSRPPLDRPPESLDRRVPVALVFTAIAAALLPHCTHVSTILALLPQGFRNAHLQLTVRLVWATIHLAFYVTVPLLLTRAFAVGASDLGLHLENTRGQLWIVATVVIGAFPLILLVSRSALFLGAYPIYRPGRADPVSTALWFGVFAAYLFSIELFFRGFLLAMLTPALGRYALLVSLVPYVATHGFLPEALGAIPVGLLLGVLRLRAGSLWPGYFTHVLVALEIELVAQWRQGLF